MKLYGIPNCNTVKKARNWLDSHHIAYEFHDFKKLGIDAKTLESWLTQYPWEKLVNRAGMTWRNLSDAEKVAVKDNTSAIHLMMSKPSVIKRPIALEANRIEAIGFVESDYEKLKR
jgi:arsenate reductase (glutaredoxin)